MEAAIAWLVQTILATLLIDKFDAWIRQVGLADDIQKLKSEVERVEMVVGDLRGRATGNRMLARSLSRLKELLYEADDVVDEIDYYRLQQQVQGVAADDPQGVPAVEQVDGTSSSHGVKKRKKWSKAWENFIVTEEDQHQNPVRARCKDCNTTIKCVAKGGTSGMRNHTRVCKEKPKANDQPTNSSSTGDATETATSIVIDDSTGRKRMREGEELAQITVANTYTPWDKAELSNRIQKITSQLQNAHEKVSEVLKLHGPEDSASSSNHYSNAASDQHLRTSSLLSRKVYGRDAEKISIKKLILEEKSDGVRVLPIVGIAGVGKTILAQLVYSDPDVETQFDQRIWVWVSRNFDEVRLTREMLEFVSQERYEGISSFARLQEILKGHVNSKRLLLIFDDVWDDMINIQWEKLLAPLVSSHVKGTVILVTTRNMTVGQTLGTLKPVKLDALANDDFWLLFKSCAFGYENYEEHQSISIIGRQIVEKLKGSPLAAVSTGELLRKKLNTDYWRNILMNEDWKSMHLSGGIMSALKLSYDQLPYHLQLCFSYCSIFPDGYQFLGEELVGFWIAHRFVKCNTSTQSLEGIGRYYLIDLVNLGFLQELKREEPYLGSQILYAVCGLMHDFAMMISRDDYASIDGLQCNKIPQTLQHLLIVTGYQHGNIHRNEKFEENLRNAVTSVRKLRTLVLLGPYNSFFLLLFQDIFEKAHNLRVLQMSATSAEFRKRGYIEVDWALPQVLSKLYHLQVLDVGSYTDPTIPDGINNLVSLRHLVVHKGVYSSIATIDSMTSFQEPHGVKFQISSGFEITQLLSTDESVEHWMHVKTLEEAYEAVLRNNKLTEKLILCWKETSVDIGMELQRLEPRPDVKDLQISGYDGDAWLSGPDKNISTSFQTVHIYGCEEWKILPSLGRFPFLTKLKLSNLEEVKEILVPSLEELVLIHMPKLERCSCTSVEGMNSRLRALQIEECKALKQFDLFENDDIFEIEQGSWLPGLRKLILCDCPHFKVLNPLPPSSTVTELLIRRVSTLPSMKGSSSEKLHIGHCDDDYDEYGGKDEVFDENSDELRILDVKSLAFHNLRNLKVMSIDGCQNLMSICLEGFSHLVSLQSLEISTCPQLFSSDVMPEHTLEDVTAANCKAFPCLEYLSIMSCGIAGKWLSLLLRHATHLEKLNLEDISSIEEGAQDGLVHIPLDLISSLKKITITDCPLLTFNWSGAGLSGFTSLQELCIWGCPELFSSLIHKDGNDDQVNGRWQLPKSLGISGCSQETLQPCFLRNHTSLKKLVVRSDPGLEYIQLHTCRALEELVIDDCASLTALEGLQSLSSLRHLKVCRCPGLPPWLESFSRQGYEPCSRLETLEISDPSILTTSVCERLTSLQCLKLRNLVLAEEQWRALVLVKSLQELEFYYCFNLVDLLAGLHLLPSLKRLTIFSCRDISRLPEKRLPLSLEELEIKFCMKELADQCRLLATSKLNVKIDNCYN